MLNNSWRGLRPGVATGREITEALGPADREVDSVKYGSVTGLRLLSYDDLTASFFLRDNRLLIVVLAPREGGEFPVNIAAWQAALGKAALKLPSIQGKNHLVHVYSESGLTAMTDGPQVTLVEVFPPMSPAEYERTLYKTPPVFVR